MQYDNDVYIYTYTYLLKLGADFTLNSVRKEQVNTLTYVVFPEGFAHNKKHPNYPSINIDLGII